MSRGGVIFVGVGCGLLIAGFATVIGFTLAERSACHDTVLVPEHSPRSGSIECPYVDQELVSEGSQWRCICPRGGTD